MIVCGTCGTRNQDDDTFCGACGTYLEWNAQSDPAAEPPPRPHDLFTRAQAVVDGTPPAPPPAPPPSTPPAAPPAPLRAVPPPPVAPPAAPPAPVPRLPDRQLQRRAVRPDAEAELVPGALICGECGAGNPPQRRFCRRCGTSLVAAAVVAQPSWWRRLLALFHRKPVAAGERPGRRRSSTASGARVGKRRRLRLGSLTGLLALVALAVTFAGPWRSTVVHRIDSVFGKAKSAIEPTYLPIHPVSARASSALPGHSAGALIDTVRQTYWASAGRGDGQRLTLELATPSRVDKVILLSGASSDPGQFVTQARVHTVLVVASGSAPQTLTLADTPNPQTFTLHVSATSAVSFVIESTYPGTVGDSTALAEIELFHRQ